MKPKTHVIYPKGANQDLLKRLSKKAMAERELRHKQAHETLLHRAKTFAKQPGLSLKDVNKAIAEQRRFVQSLYPQKEPPAFTPLKGHNPARYAPFDMTWSSINCDGDGTCSLRGPDATTGQIGAHLDLEGEGAMSAISSVGFWYYAATADTLYITVQANIFGRALAINGETYAGLQIYVEQYSPDFTVFAATTDIFRSNVLGLIYVDEEGNFDRTVVEALGAFDYWNGRTVSIAIPLQPDTWYAIWADALQNVAFPYGAVSDFDMYVGPISYFSV